MAEMGKVSQPLHRLFVFEAGLGIKDDGDTGYKSVVIIDRDAAVIWFEDALDAYDEANLDEEINFTVEYPSTRNRRR